MHVKRIAVAAATWIFFISIATAEEPFLLPEPGAKAIKDDAGTGDVDAEGLPSEEKGKTTRRAADQQFGGYPYSRAWHAGYNHPRWGQPVALVVPPHVQYQTIWNRAVGATQITPIYPQFAGPAYGAPIEAPGPYGATPYWPWDTRQFGVYYIRGPR